MEYGVHASPHAPPHASRAALLWLTSGMYGTCIACDEDIEPERLDKYPAAPRCYLCQQAF